MKPTLINLKALQDIKNKLQTNIQNQVKQTVIKQGCSSCGGGGGTVKQLDFFLVFFMVL